MIFSLVSKVFQALPTLQLMILVYQFLQNRLITYIDYEAQIVFIRAVLTHSDYDKENWKNDNWYQNT